jgi:hypothetical protein
MIDNFDSTFYFDFYPDLKNNLDNDPIQAYNHYLNIGKKKEFIPNKNFLLDNFDWEFYFDFYSDIKNQLDNKPFRGYNHYLKYGKTEKRIPNLKELNIHILNQEIKILNEKIDFIITSKYNNQKLINILIRTSNRPSYFNTCIKSILSQEYSNYRVIICYDKLESLDYLNNYKENKKIEFYPIQIDSCEKYKFNLYCNFLVNKVEKGWIMFLDDDDKLTHENVFNIINNNINDDNDDDMLIWNFFRPDKLIFPKNIHKINLGEIDTSSFCFHSSNIVAQWGDKRYGDYAFFSKLTSSHTFKIKHIDYILTQTIFKDKVGNFGN